MDNNETPRLVWSSTINMFIGELLTLVDASIADVEQRKALKDIVRQMTWRWVHNSMFLLDSKGLSSPDFTIAKGQEPIPVQPPIN